jgi:drug/metabolite transporter (DMT)-like permease
VVGRRIDPAVVLAGLFFAGDLVFWHLAILNTSVANATFLATIAPVWVVLGSRLFLGEGVAPRVVGGLVLCLLGGAAIVGASARFAPDRLLGDFYGLITSMFFGAYFLAVRAAGRRLPPGRITFQSTVVTALALLLVALGLDTSLIPASPGGMAALAALALVSHAGGQGLLAFALGRLPAAFSSLVIFVEAVFAPVLAWFVFREGIGVSQLFGGALILAGIAVARPRRGDRNALAPVPAQ